MMTSRNNTKLIEQYLQGKLPVSRQIAFEARLLLQPKLRMDLYFQKKTYRLVQLYHRKKLKEELETVHQQIFSDPDKVDFQENIYRLFK
ncbi:MAG: hypothetical protein HUU01_17285 [Saprospiraceae bacterium]|nr:hypothetical protein [Saprospiraceae bacterium]